MKRCPWCGQTKPLSDFHRSRARRDGHQSICKSCRAVLDHARYEARRGEVVPRKQQRSPDAGRTAWLLALKSSACTDCGKTYPAQAMQWDHLPGTSKVADVSMLRTQPRERILEEIAKCELVCANCHAIRTFRRAGWYEPAGELREAPVSYWLTAVAAT